MKTPQAETTSAPAATVGELPACACAVPVGTTCGQVYALFVADAYLPGVVVHDSTGALRSLLSRQRFMEVFSQTYRREVYFSRSLDVLLHNEFFEPLCVRASTTVVQAAELALNRPRERFNEPIAIAFEAHVYKVLETQDLLFALVNTHAYQHAQLQLALESLVETEKFASLGALVAGVAHEINTPVGVSLSAASHLHERVSGFGKLLERQQIRKADLADFVEDARDASSIILHNMERAAGLIRSFKQVAADQTSESRRQFDLRQAVGEILFNLGPSFKHSAISLGHTVEEGLAMDSFPGALAQVLSNLVLNSQTHAFSEETPGQITVFATGLGKGQEVEIRVQDNGAGIAADVIGRVFDPFFTTRRNRGGTGLGLHIVYNLVSNTLGGKIAVQSAPGQGTVFVIRIPRIPA